MEHAPLALDPNRTTKLQRIGRQLAATAVAVSTVAVGVFVVHRMNAPTEVFASKPEWEQNFALTPDGPPDSAVWNYDLRPEVPSWNNEAQAYTSNERNVRIEDGKLVLQALREPTTYPNDPSGHVYAFSSARLDTRDKFSFLYGKIEARMKLAEGEGAWPAFWLLSATGKYTEILKTNPELAAEKGAYTRDGELDIMEQASSDGCKVSATVHTYASRHKPATNSTIVPRCADTFHTYAMEWKPDSITFLVDDKPYHIIRKTSDDPEKHPFDQPAYLILNLAMGGTMGGTVDPARNQWQVAIERVSYYPLLSH